MNKCSKENQEYTKEMEQEDDEWQPGMDDAIGTYTYVWIAAGIDNHYAQYNYINDWKGKDVALDPVIHSITFYEGFSSMVLDLGMF